MRLFVILSLGIGFVILSALLPVPKETRAQVPVVASMVFIDSDSACSSWSNNSGPYNLTQAPNPATSLKIYVNGVKWALGTDFGLNGSSVTLVNGQTINPGDVVSCDYRVVTIGQ
jgi:hypothetical protein